MQDEMVFYMALVRGESRILAGPLTLNAETAIHIATQLTYAKFTVTRVSSDSGVNSSNIIQCQGIGYAI